MVDVTTERLACHCVQAIPRVVRGGFLLDGNRWGKPFDVVDIRLFHHRQELAGIGRQRLDVAPLPFRKDRVERQRRLARTRQPGDHDQLVTRQVKVDVFQVMGACAANADEFFHRVCKLVPNKKRSLGEHLHECKRPQPQAWVAGFGRKGDFPLHDERRRILFKSMCY